MNYSDAILQFVRKIFDGTYSLYSHGVRKDWYGGQRPSAIDRSSETRNSEIRARISTLLEDFRLKIDANGRRKSKSSYYYGVRRRCRKCATAARNITKPLGHGRGGRGVPSEKYATGNGCEQSISA